MSNKNELLKKALLGSKLYKKCGTDYNFNVPLQEFETRYSKVKNEILNDSLFVNTITQLGADYNALSNCTIDDFANFCGINLNNFDLNDCLSNEIKNKVYYDNYKENYYYDIFELDCSNKTHKKMLKYFQKLEEDQKGEFTKYLSLNSSGCRTKYTYYIAFNEIDENIGGVCQVAPLDADGVVYINLLTTRAGKTKSELYKGVGTLILNHIVKKYNKPTNDLTGISLEADPLAIPFYLKYGFTYTNPKDKDNSGFFYPFDSVKDLTTLNPSSKVAMNYLQNVLDFRNEDLVIELKKLGVKLIPERLDNSRLNNLAVRYFINELAMTQDIFEKEILASNIYSVIPEYLRAGYKISDEDILYNLFEESLERGSIKEYLNDILQEIFKQGYFNMISERTLQAILSLSISKLYGKCVDTLVFSYNVKPNQYQYELIKEKKKNLDDIYNIVSSNYVKNP
jgi:hypothetical protein